MPKKREYRLTLRKIAPVAIEFLGHAQRGAIILGQWANRDHAILAMILYKADNPQCYAAGSAVARLVITEVSR